MKTFFNIDSGVPGVRLAQPKDESELFGLICMLHGELGLFSLNRDKVMAGIKWATERQGGVIYCIDEGPRVVATLGMTIAQDWYSDDQYLLERWNFVHPDYRRSEYARMLLEQAKWAHEWFKREGALLPFFCGINSFHRTEAKIRMYARHMPLLGAYFMYGLAPRQQDAVMEATRRIEEANRKSRANRSREVVPAVETLIRVSQRQEAEHVRQ